MKMEKTIQELISYLKLLKIDLFTTINHLTEDTNRIQQEIWWLEKELEDAKNNNDNG